MAADLARIREHERQFGPGEFGGYTHATWREVKAAEAQVETSDSSEWLLVFDLVRRLEADERLSADRIRFVVWYCW